MKVSSREGIKARRIAWDCPHILAPFCFSREKGFTVFEVVLGIAIFAIIAFSSVPMVIDVYRGLVLESEVKTLLVVVRQAESLAWSNKGESGHGVYIGADNYVVFRGGAYASRDPGFDKLHRRSDYISISGPSEVVFDAISGNVGSALNWSLSNDSDSRGLIINDYGAVSW